MVEERSLKVLSNETTFFNKVSSTLTRLLIPTKIGINGIMINIKRSSAIKSYEQLKNAEKNKKSKSEVIRKSLRIPPMSTITSLRINSTYNMAIYCNRSFATSLYQDSHRIILSA